MLFVLDVVPPPLMNVNVLEIFVTIFLSTSKPLLLSWVAADHLRLTNYASADGVKDTSSTGTAFSPPE